jgi:hypothetical protein
MLEKKKDNLHKSKIKKEFVAKKETFIASTFYLLFLSPTSFVPPSVLFSFLLTNLFSLMFFFLFFHSPSPVLLGLVTAF